MVWRRQRSGMIFPAATGGLTTLSFIASTIADADSITAPASINSGDLLVMFDYSGKPSGGGTPTGFTNIFDTSGAYVDIIASYKIADGTEDSSSITGLTGGYAGLKIIQQFRGDDTISSISAQDIASQVTDGDPSTQTCNASLGSSPLIVFGMYGSHDTISTRTFSPTEDGETDNTGSAEQLHAKYKIYNSSPADVTIDMGAVDFQNALGSFYLEAS